jgi:hypothetical protein
MPSPYRVPVLKMPRKPRKRPAYKVPAPLAGILAAAAFFGWTWAAIGLYLTDRLAVSAAQAVEALKVSQAATIEAARSCPHATPDSTVWSYPNVQLTGNVTTTPGTWLGTPPLTQPDYAIFQAQSGDVTCVGGICTPRKGSP